MADEYDDILAPYSEFQGRGDVPSFLPLPPLRPRRVLENDYSRPLPPRVQQEVAENISPTMGAYGLAGLGTTAALDASHGKYDPNTLLPLAAAIFAGPRAKTANLAMMERAQAMAAKGAPREAIWNETGWFQGRDGKWRFEIDDSPSRIPDPAFKELYSQWETRGAQMPSGLDHPALYAAYPELKDAAFHYTLNPTDRGGTGTFSPDIRMDNKGYTYPSPGAPGLVSAEASNPQTVRSVALHELGGHGVQNIEGFAGGSAPGRVGEWLDAQIGPLNKTMSDMAKNGKYGSPEYEALKVKRDGLIEQSWQLNKPENAMDSYRREAGEVEARNVQKRMNMTPEERGATPPWETQDVPDIQQILRETYGNGPQMSAADLPMDQASRMARAKQQGYQIDSPMWHGTKASVSEFDLRKAGKSDPGLVGRAVYGTPEREQAGQFAMSPHYGRGDAPNVMPLLHRMEKPAIIQDGRLPDGRTLTEAHPRGITKESGEALKRQLMAAGYDGAIFKLGDEIAQYAVFDPKKVRSPQAAFDPAKRNSAKLLASMTGAAVLPGILLDRYGQETR